MLGRLRGLSSALRRQAGRFTSQSATPLQPPQPSAAAAGKSEDHPVQQAAPLMSPAAVCERMTLLLKAGDIEGVMLTYRYSAAKSTATTTTSSSSTTTTTTTTITNSNSTTTTIAIVFHA